MIEQTLRLCEVLLLEVRVAQQAASNSCIRISISAIRFPDQSNQLNLPLDLIEEPIKFVIRTILMFEVDFLARGGCVNSYVRLRRSLSIVLLITLFI